MIVFNLVVKVSSCVAKSLHSFVKANSRAVLACCCSVKVFTCCCNTSILSDSPLNDLSTLVSPLVESLKAFSNAVCKSFSNSVAIIYSACERGAKPLHEIGRPSSMSL